MEDVIVNCPHCGKKSHVVARIAQFNEGKAGVIKNHEECFIDWETIDLDVNWSYECDECGKKLADTLEELQEKFFN